MTDRTHLPAQRPKRCRCATCRFAKSVRRIQGNLSRYDRAIIERLLNKWAMESTDAAFYRIKLREAQVENWS
jgi:hypothetical protein